MFKKKTLVVSYIYSFDYSKEPVQLNDLMFKEVPVKQKWGKYVLLNSEDQERFGLSVTKKDFEKALKKGCCYVVGGVNWYIVPKNLMFMAIDVLNEQQKKGIYIMVKEMIIRFSTFSAIVILVAFLTKSEAVTLYVIGLTSGLMIGYAYGNRNN